MVTTIQPRYEFRIFGNDLEKFEEKIKDLCKEEMTRNMDSVYLLTPWKRKNNIKIRQGVMDIKNLEQEVNGLEQWNPVLIGEFPMRAEIIKTTVFPALGIESPIFEREEYSLKQFLKEVVSIDPDLSVAYVWKTRHAYSIGGCITETAEIKVNGTSVKTICIEAEDPEKVLEAKKMIGIDDKTENVNYPKALKRFMGLTQLPDEWNNINF